MDSRIVIMAQGLGRRFGDTVAVRDLALEVHAGEVFGFLGHNGAGKTTTVRLLNGLLAPTAGTAKVLGLDPIADGPALRRRAGVLTETPSLEERLSAREGLGIYADLYGVPRGEVGRRVDELLAAFDLGDRADEKVGGYSKGMKQRLALARALLHRPEVLYLDEPTAGLDPQATRQVHELITRLSREEGRTVFLCTHNLAEAQALCDRVAVLEHGHVLAMGTPADLARQVGRTRRTEVEVAPDDMATALEALRAMPGFTSSAANGGAIAVQGVEREMIPQIVAALVRAGTRVYRVVPQEPSLEDVYFALYEAEEGGR